MTVRVKSLSHLKPVCFILFFFLCIFILPVSHADAAEIIYTNEVTGFEAVIDDRAKLLTATDEYYGKMTEEMKKITSCGNVAFVSVSINPYSSARKCAKNTMRDLFGKESSTVFIVDMENREIGVYSSGKILKTVTQSRGYIITDNIYRYATGAHYDECAYEAYRQENDLLDGRGIAQPMKYISSILLSLIFAGIIVYENARSHSSVSAVRADDLLENTNYRMGIKNLNIVNKSKKRTMHESESRRSGGGHRGGGNHDSGSSYDDSDSSYDSGGGFFGDDGGGFGGGSHKF